MHNNNNLFGLKLKHNTRKKWNYCVKAMPPICGTVFNKVRLAIIIFVFFCALPIPLQIFDIKIRRDHEKNNQETKTCFAERPQCWREYKKKQDRRGNGYHMRIHSETQNHNSCICTHLLCDNARESFARLCAALLS
jgi:hypothetical protein